MSIQNLILTIGAIIVSGYMSYRAYMYRTEQHNANQPRSDAGRHIDYVQEPDVNCPICQSILGETEIRVLPCGHAMHQVCWTQFIGNAFQKCPLCNRTF